jgi:hypothetical protein
VRVSTINVFTGSPKDDGETLPPVRVEGKDILQVWNESMPRFMRSRENILLCRDIEAGREVSPLPSTFDDEAADSLVPKLPQRQLLPLRLTSTLGAKRPKIKRTAIGPGLRAQKNADDLETWLNAVLEQVVDWREIVGRGIQDGEYAVIVLPSTADCTNFPDFIDTLTGKPAKRYWRDKQGRAPDEPGWSGRRHIGSTRKAYREEVLDYLARRLPFMVRVVSATDCIPIFGPRNRLEGLAVRTLYTKNSLIRRQYRWIMEGKEMGNKMLLTPEETGAQDYGEGGHVYLYEYYGLDEKSLPYVSYSVGGCDTWYADEDPDNPACINLFEEYGLTRLPVIYSYGMRFANDNPDEKAVPFLLPLASVILNIEANLGSATVYARRMAFPAYVETPNPNSPVENLPEASDLRVMELPSGGGIIRANGNIAPLVPGSMGQDVRWLTAVQMEALSDSSPNEAATGGNTQAQSGHAMTLSREYLEVANSMILEGGRTAYEQVASLILEIAIGIQRKFEKSIPVYENVEVPPTEKSKGTESRQVIELKEEWVGPVYDVQAIYPKDSANIAEIQQVADLADRGYATFEDVMEVRGKSSPALERAKIFADQWFKSDQGIAEVAALVARLRGEDERAAQLEMQTGGHITESGFPVDALDPEAVQAEQMMAEQAMAMGMDPAMMQEAAAGGMPGGGGMQPPQNPQMGGMQTPDYAANTLNATVAGEMGVAARSRSEQGAAAIPGGI